MHLLGLSEQVTDGELSMMALPGMLESVVMAKKFDNVVAAGTGVWRRP